MDIRIFSDSPDTAQIESGIKQVKINGHNPRIIRLKNFVFNKNDILIFQVNQIQSKYLNKINAVKDTNLNKLIFIVSVNDAVLVSAISKLNIGKIFVLPDEIYSFISHLHEILQKEPNRVSEKIAPNI